MPVHFAALASGSGGNAALVHGGTAGLLIDVGLGPRRLGQRLDGVGSRWEQVAAVLLTHTHGDHVTRASIRWLARRRIALICHEGHRAALQEFAGFDTLDRLRLVRYYDDRPFLTPDGSRAEALELSHDSGPTFGFRLEVRPTGRGRPIGLGYVADTGCWTPPLADALADVDLLAIEFNHDVRLQVASGRPPFLIARNLGDRGHLSNDQGAELLGEVLRRSRAGSIRQVVLLHLSRDCNRPPLALASARAALRQAGRRAVVYAATQDAPHPHVSIAAGPRRPRPAPIGFPWERPDPRLDP
jgi:phosphoribosyl 1,2-cyclic phosphodiesterase